MGQRTVLIVEDDTDIRNTLEVIFQDEGYNTRVAHDGQEALHLIPQLPEPAVILLDLMMPRIDGAGVIRNLADHPEKRDDHPIFLLTANVSQLSPDVTQLLGREGIPVLPKPFDVEKLLGEVSSAFARIGQEQS
jgi:CheY-like chemotaxis protein